MVSNKDAPFLSVSPDVFRLYIDELEAYLHKIDGDFPCLFNTMITNLLYTKNVVMFSKTMSKFTKTQQDVWICIPSSLHINLSKTKIAIFGQNTNITK